MENSQNYDSREIAARIKSMAKVRNMQIGDILDACNLSKNTLSSMLSGSMPKSENLAKIADYLNVSVDYLLGRSEKEKSTEDNDLGGLSEDERLLISLLRKIPDEDRPAVERMIHAFVKEDS